MAIEKFPHISEIAWGKIREIRVSRDGEAYGFEFMLHGRKQKMTIMVRGATTTYTLSTDDGTPVVHAVQKGREIRVLDFSSKPKIKGAKKLKGMRISKRK